MPEICANPRVLVADDSRIWAERLVELVTERGDIDIVGPAYDGQEALDLLRKHHPEGALLDLRMPNLSGLDVWRQYKAEGVPCFVVILTSQLEPSVQEQCFKAGVSHLLSKSEALECMGELMDALVAMAAKT